MDGAVTAWINGFAGTAFFDAVMTAVSAYGVPVIVVLVAAQWFTGAKGSRIRHVLIVAGLAFLASLAINQIVLMFVHRIRPYDAGVTLLLIARSADWSFPSDHASASVAVATAFLAKNLRARGAVLAALAFLICLSRVFLGTHYVGDVVGGAVTGIVAALVVVRYFREGNVVDRTAKSIL